MVRHPIAKTRTISDSNHSSRPNPNQYAHPDAPKPIHPDKEHFCSSTLKLGAYIRPSVVRSDLCRSRPNRKPKLDFLINDQTPVAIGHPPDTTPQTPNGGDGRNRTDDPLLAKQALYQLSYIPNYSERPEANKEKGFFFEQKKQKTLLIPGHGHCQRQRPKPSIAKILRRF